MEQPTNSVPQTIFTFKGWILYPAISGAMFGLGTFTIFYLSIQLMKQNWFLVALKKMAIEFENKSII